MAAGTVLILVVVGILGIVLGWMVPICFKSERPCGLDGSQCYLPSATRTTIFFLRRPLE